MAPSPSTFVFVAVVALTTVVLWELAARPHVLTLPVAPARSASHPDGGSVGDTSQRQSQIVTALIDKGSLTDARTLARPEDAGYFSPVANAPRSDNPIAEFFLTTQGRIVFKPMHYFDIYYRHLSRFRNMGRPIHVMEIGLYCGGSLQMWRNFFGPEAYIYGVDIFPKRRFAEERTKIFTGDQANMTFWKEMKRTIPKLDIIIDDGGHLPEQQRNTFKALFDHLQPDGAYVVEDVHTSFMADYQGGIGKRGTFVEFSKRWIDALHCSFAEGCSKELLHWNSGIASVSFYECIIIMEKRPHVVPVSFKLGVGDEQRCWDADPSR
jgi:hypothetical protein